MELVLLLVEEEAAVVVVFVDVCSKLQKIQTDPFSHPATSQIQSILSSVMPYAVSRHVTLLLVHRSQSGMLSLRLAGVIEGNNEGSSTSACDAKRGAEQSLMVGAELEDCGCPFSPSLPFAAC